MEKISTLQTPQSQIAVAEVPIRNELALCEDGNYLLLENLEDPGNIGTIMRTVEALGVRGVLFCGSAVDVYSPKVLRGSMGSSLRVPTKHFENANEAVQAFRSANMSLWGGALCDSSIPVTQMREGCSVIAVGNESTGLSSELLSACEGVIRIPMASNVDSLSAPIAAAILLWEVWGRQRCDT